jgi:hypothetical protein
MPPVLGFDTHFAEPRVFKAPQTDEVLIVLLQKGEVPLEVERRLGVLQVVPGVLTCEVDGFPAVVGEVTGISG